MAECGASVLWSGLVLVLLSLCLSTPGAAAEPEQATQSVEAETPLTRHPCRNGGTLIRVNETYFRCNCTGTGYKGPTCEEDETPFRRHPCRNGGTFIRVNKTYFRCNCTGTAYEGSTCEKAVTACDNQPCQNGGTCTVTGETAENYSCDCTGTGYKGPTCEEESNDEHCISRPDHPFKVVWNHPDECDRQKNTTLPLKEFGFTFNLDRKFLGEEILTLYDTGKWPVIKNCKEFHGGVPQRFDDTSFNTTRADLQKVRVSNFTGIGCLTFIDWRAVYDTNFGSLEKYWTKSLVLVREKHLTYDITLVHSEAEKQWDKGAKDIMLKKLEIARELMPDGRWGYQVYPRTWYGDLTKTINNKMDWLWRKATGLYPPIYSKEYRQEDFVNRIKKRLAEAIRIQDTFSPPNTDIYPYIKMRNQDEKLFRNRKFMQKAITLAANMGASGVILWGSSHLYTKHGMCTKVQKDIREKLGPFVKNLTTKMLECSNQVCNGNGRCVLISEDVLLTQDASQERCVSNQTFSDYQCRCYSGYDGACCENVLQTSPCHKR